MQMVCGAIAHEIRTHLAIIRINTDNLKTAKKEERNKLIDKIQFAIDEASNMLEMFLIKLHNIYSKQNNKNKLELCPIKQDINNAIKEYPFRNGERENICWDSKTNENFIYAGNSLLTKHILFNLIKNSLKAIKETGHGKIFVHLTKTDKYNTLAFKDTAAGMSKEVLSSLFQAFNSHSENGAGLGLIYCKLTMEAYGGTITCNTKKGEYTEFVLSFPLLES